jgi:dihydroorotate dehydrogenase electron transfer subunit
MNMPKVLNETIQKMEQLSQGIYRMRIFSPDMVKEAKPGQFVNIKCCDGLNAILRRPISICNVDRKKETVDIVFQVKGAGTEYLCRKAANDRVDMLAPLGTPFDLADRYRKVAVIGGGIGVFPLLFLLLHHR